VPLVPRGASKKPKGLLSKTPDRHTYDAESISSTTSIFPIHPSGMTS
jgi:hypothetical protein